MKDLRSVLLFSLALASCSAPSDRSASAAATSGKASRSSVRELPVGAQCWSASGRPLYAMPVSSEEFARRAAALEAAREHWEAQPDDPDALIWVGRRLGYLGRYREAIEVFTIGVDRHPQDARMLRHRGHRWISLREFERAKADLGKAASMVEGRPDEVEPDGMPNARGIPLETLKSNIYYHLALAQYLVGDFAEAERTWRECLKHSVNPDNLCSGTHWLHQTLLRRGKTADAARALDPIRADLDVIEYHGYFELCRAYKGELDMEDVYARSKAKGGVEAASVGYGAGAWHLAHGRRERARQIFRELVAGDAYYAFGYIASEVELERMGWNDTTSAAP